MHFLLFVPSVKTYVTLGQLY